MPGGSVTFPPWFTLLGPCGPACDIALLAGLGVRLGLSAGISEVAVVVLGVGDLGRVFG